MLRKSLQDILLPKFEELGFHHVPVRKEHGREWVSSSPFGDHRRSTAKGNEQIEILLSEAPRTGFQILFGLVPREGLTFWQDWTRKEKIFHPMEQIPVGWLPVEGALCKSTWRNPFTQIWSVWGKPWRPKTKSDFDKVVSRACLLVPEIDQYFKTGKIGPHCRITKFPGPLFCSLGDTTDQTKKLDVS
jgi:hypothetical protein